MALSSNQFPHLFSPVEIGPAKLKKRIFVSPHSTMFASDGDYLPGKSLPPIARNVRREALV